MTWLLIFGFVVSLPLTLGMFLAFCGFWRDLLSDGKKHGIW